MPQNRQKDQISQIQNDLKNSIKNLYLDNKKKDKTINDHSALVDKIRREYSELYKESQNLKLAIQNYEIYYNDHQLDNYNSCHKRQKYIPKKYKRKRKYQKPYNSSSSKTEDEEIIVPRRKKRRQKKAFIMMMMLMSMLTKLTHITIQLHQHIMMMMIMLMIVKKQMLKP